MKSILIATVTLLSGVFQAYSQTTQEEYNYLTKVYLEDLKAGKIKAGYTIGNTQTISTEDKAIYTIEFRSINRTDGELAAVLMIVKQNAALKDRDYPIVIPVKSPTLKRQFYDRVNKMFPNPGNEYVKVTAEMVVAYFSSSSSFSKQSDK